MGNVLYELRLLAKRDIVETSGPDLMGAYLGHSRKAMEEKLREAQGGLLFIDEAYTLLSNDEALPQLLTMLTLDEFTGGKTVVVLAGYKEQMHEMLNANQGLKVRLMCSLFLSRVFSHFHAVSVPIRWLS